MPESTPATPPSFLGELFRKSFNDALAQALPSDWKVSIADDQPQASDNPSLWYGLTASGAVKGSASIQLTAADATLLAQKLLAESADSAAELNSNRKQAIQNLLTKVSEFFGAGLTSIGFKASCKIDPIEAPTWRGPTVTLAVSEPAMNSLKLRLQFDADLLASISAPPQPDAPTEVNTSAVKAQIGGENNLDLLLGVDLNLTLRFGQRTLTLREIMDLSSGSIIELDRQVQEPADLLLGDKLIARGEVVVVDGNYGLRITEVAEQVSDSERMSASAM